MAIGIARCYSHCCANIRVIKEIGVHGGPNDIGPITLPLVASRSKAINVSNIVGCGQGQIFSCSTAYNYTACG